MHDHTKNLPWRVFNDSERTEPCWSVLDSTGRLVTWFNYGGHYRGEAEAEALAKMVAAGSVAPELLEALKEAWCWLDHRDGGNPDKRGAKCDTFTEALEMIEDAIAKGG